VRFAVRPEELADADLVVVPGTRATVSDLAWMRSRGLAGAITGRAARGEPVLGICGGYQMLGQEIQDDVESGQGQVAGLGLLPVRTVFGGQKRLGRPAGRAYGEPVTGYEIHHGVAEVLAGSTAAAFLDGCRVGAVWGTTWHGTLENDGFRRAFLAEVAAVTGRDFRPAPDTDFAALRQAGLDAMGDLIADHLDTARLEKLITGGPPGGLPVIPPAGTGAPAG
jgi:adenosylcobyric acid synthase